MRELLRAKVTEIYGEEDEEGCAQSCGTKGKGRGTRVKRRKEVRVKKTAAVSRAKARLQPYGPLRSTLRTLGWIIIGAADYHFVLLYARYAATVNECF